VVVSPQRAAGDPVSWQEETMDKWIGLLLEDGDDFETVAKVSLQQACCMVEAALLRPEWAAGFLAAARGGAVLSARSDMEADEFTRMFPVAMPV